MTEPTTSIIISSYKRLPLLRRTLYSINSARPLENNVELVIADEISDESPQILDELKLYNFPWTYIACDIKEFEEKTGIKKYYNNPSWTNNVAFKYSLGKFVITMGNDCLIICNGLSDLITEAEKIENDFILYSTTLNSTSQILSEIGEYGQGLTLRHMKECAKWPLQTVNMKTAVTNYLSISPRKTWNLIKGYDLEYLKSIAAEDSCFSRRITAIPNSISKVLPNVFSIHQFHESKQFNDTTFWEKGVSIARAKYHDWDGSYELKQEWPIGSYGIKEVIRNS